MQTRFFNYNIVFKYRNYDSYLLILFIFKINVNKIGDATPKLNDV